MSYLASSLRQEGYRVRVWGYPSLTVPIDRLGEDFARYLETVASSAENEPNGPLHLVAHSMGNLVAREALRKVDVAVGRWTMLAPPNGGSPAADRFAPWLGGILRPLKQMRTCPESYVHSLGYPDGPEIGVIAASYDFVVADGSSVCPSMVDRIAVRSTHSGMLFSPETARQVKAFLREGRFAREERTRRAA
jgi:pimeloyl-ACP methyl ester carboxylesterase